jgi:hypothetical protein
MQKPLHPAEAAFLTRPFIWHGRGIFVNAWHCAIAYHLDTLGATAQISGITTPLMAVISYRCTWSWLANGVCYLSNFWRTGGKIYTEKRIIAGRGIKPATPR